MRDVSGTYIPSREADTKQLIIYVTALVMNAVWRICQGSDLI